VDGEAAAELHEAVRAAGINFVASLPDDWLVPLINRLEADPDVIHIGVAREPEIVGLCAGAWLGGRRPMGLMGIAGLLACGHEFVTLNLAHQMPMLILASRRGSIEDPRTFQVGQGLVVDKYLEAVNADQLTLETKDDAALLPDAYRRALLIKRPLVCFARRAVFMGA
jgi:sulfopyruvate decarboxylase subunit alpha